MRKAKVLRSIKLLSSGSVAKIDPSLWLQVRGAKEFDASKTQILRVFKTRNEERYLVYGSHSSGWNKAKKAYDVQTEAYDAVAMPEALEATIAAVAKHCGVEKLIEKMAARDDAKR